MPTPAKDVLLSKKALKLLRQISTKEFPYNSKLWNSPEGRELDYYSLAYPTHSTGKSRVLQVTDKGRQVLLWYDNRREDQTHDWKIAIFSAVSGALLSQPVWALLHFFADLILGNLS